MGSLLEVRFDSASYGSVSVLRDLRLTVGAGEIVAVLGNNGVGKTTLLRAISGWQVASSGSVQFDGREMSSLPAHRRARAGIVHVPEGRRVFGDLTVEENLRVGALHAPGRQTFEEKATTALGLFPALERLQRRRASSLSGGEQQMLAIARGLMAEPLLLMVDEASLGLAPIIIRQVFDGLEAIRSMGVAVLVVEQNVRTSLAAADRGYVLERGTVTASGTAQELLADERVVDAYLGGAPPTPTPAPPAI